MVYSIKLEDDGYETKQSLKEGYIYMNTNFSLHAVSSEIMTVGMLGMDPEISPREKYELWRSATLSH
jgi:uncharacterized protein affecting Mg2+/Co2+ transport